MGSRSYAFGPYKIDENEVFYVTHLSYAMVNLRPLLPDFDAANLTSLRREVKCFVDLTDEETSDMWLTARKVGSQLENYHKASSLTFSIQDGPQAGQTVPHVHIHIIPRRGGDFEENDEIYDALDAKEIELKKKLDLDIERKDRSPEEMAQELDEYRKLLMKNRVPGEEIIPINNDAPGEQIIPIYNDASDKITRVPPILKNVMSNKNCYEPMMVSIGPYHHNNKELREMENMKPEIARRFTFPSKRSFDDIIQDQRFQRILSEAKDYYSEAPVSNENNGTDDFAKMMFLDGCFVLHLIHCIMKKKHENEDRVLKNHQVAFAVRDLFLLENQLPFIVLQAIMTMKFQPIDWEMVRDFIRQQHMAPHCAVSDIGRGYQPLHLLELLRTEIVGVAADVGKINSAEGDYRVTFRSVTELKAAGIHFKGNACSLREISFKSHLFHGELLLPKIYIDDSIESKFLNLIAYEMSSDTPNEYAIASYICFINSLLDHAEDVKELRKDDVLVNYLGSDKQVAELFHRIATNLVPDPYLYKDVKEKIKKHCNDKKRTYVSEFLHIYFDKPWSGVALFAAILALFTSMVQAYFAAFSTNNSSSTCCAKPSGT
ncbi:Protein of unknown function DUF247, plant [Dillenia turbinata]|uniref:HIT domain-containing protein n=1 Tax=Dillenia turbinata TaxID=194707 RepID=A0AAN8VV12_9MAGN